MNKRNLQPLADFAGSLTFGAALTAGISLLVRSAVVAWTGVSIPFQPVFLGGLLIGTALHTLISGLWNFFLAPVAYHLHSSLQLSKLRKYRKANLISKHRASALAARIIEAEISGRRLTFELPVRYSQDGQKRTNRAQRVKLPLSSPSIGLSDDALPGRSFPRSTGVARETPTSLYAQVSLESIQKLIGCVATLRVCTPDADLKRLIPIEFVGKLPEFASAHGPECEMTAERASAALMRIRACLADNQNRNELLEAASEAEMHLVRLVARLL